MSTNQNGNNNPVMEKMNEFTEFWEQLADENDRGVALSAGEMFSELLKEMLLRKLSDTKESKALIEGFNAPIGTYSARIKLAYALSYITEDEKKDLECIRKIRNEFAHSWRKVSFEDTKVVAQCKNLIHCDEDLKSPLSHLYRPPREQFNIGCTKLSHALLTHYLQDV
ncbi:MltR family transcriptional regulator [Vibrio parahaemolyticus]|uniref:MltR family transcriptional regulator n=1 Tax=Vibrio parahaemolyticus TaxID=670 RepID=UPI000D549870|nr:MltR family transcriptional regulator [Vibrio parahaemolyticus]AWG83697.1 hypothetical protein Vp2S01_1357 [Vibrio parahaemolyticus]ELB2094449.1 hypothetical protein [Vibrio parahaemolyticus]ELB2126760.1 hypothetical protein [Vibrio parahaemolyticus]MCX4129307.1 MltR family transcriptional regulator [Vibrio parahaemolyticus]MCX8824606.1 MltR family transcriptional regulator [Vibrio parahaemolyticus]